MVAAVFISFMRWVTTILLHHRAQRDLDRILAVLPSHIHAPLKPSLPSDWKLQVLRRVEPVTILADNRIVFGGDVTQAAVALDLAEPTR